MVSGIGALEPPSDGKDLFECFLLEFVALFPSTGE
jgi:hypothetical protein